MGAEHNIAFARIKSLFLNRRIGFYIALIALVSAVYEMGFIKEHEPKEVLFKVLYTLSICYEAIGIFIRNFIVKTESKKLQIVDLFFLAFTLFITASEFGILDGLVTVDSQKWLHFAVFYIFIRSYAALKIDFKRVIINPAQLFILSFIAIIFLGTALLLLPNATYSGISIINALFTATSAVCVTGLIVVDTASYFTPFGQSIILFLIQIGGIGIMTFASYFSYFFKGGSSYNNQLILRDMNNAEKIGEVFHTLKKIIIITFLIEAIGAIFIFLTLNGSVVKGFSEKLFFSVFHSISGFCNAGFSTLTHGLNEGNFQFNYPLQLIIAALFIVGGLGFPIVFNLVTYLKLFVKRKIKALLQYEKERYTPWVVNINTRIVLITSTALTVTGTILFYIFEYNNTLVNHNGFGKVVTAFFGAVTPRTAGFNTVDTASLSFATLMILFLLMWVGASPGSTGGGIKTSTFAIATLNFISLAKGKDRIEVFRREISTLSMRRAFAIISLSLLVIGLAIFAIAYFDSEKDLLTIAFECFSAYSTVGLSLGITDALSNPSKGVIIAVMFIGRVSTLTLLIAVMKKTAYKNYKYPSEEILIN